MSWAFNPLNLSQFDAAIIGLCILFIGIAYLLIEHFYRRAIKAKMMEGTGQ